MWSGMVKSRDDGEMGQGRNEMSGFGIFPPGEEKEGCWLQGLQGKVTTAFKEAWG